MNFATHFALTVSLSLLLLSGCSTGSDSPAAPVNTASLEIDGSKFLLDQEPEGAVGVISAMESAKDGDPLVMVGRIGGSESPWIEGRAAFTLLDASINVVAPGEANEGGEICEDDCCATELLDSSALVKVVDADGRLVPADARQLLGLKKSDMVVVQGTAQKDESGNFVMLAKGVYARK